jgi:dipeptidyl-peptidase 4
VNVAHRQAAVDVTPWAAIAGVIATVSVFAIAQGLSYPLLSFILQRQGVSPGMIGLSAAMTPIGFIVSSPIIPALTRRFGAGRTALTCAALSALVLFLIGADGRDDRTLAGEDDPAVSWGLAEFVAAEEMDRYHGFWWSPDGEQIAAARADESAVQVWHIADPADPAAEPVTVRYPAAGTANADVTLHVLSMDGPPIEVVWVRQLFEYLARVVWTEGRPLTLMVQSRDQRHALTLAARDDGTTELLREDRDDAWVDLVDGSPAWLADGRMVLTTDAGDTRRLVVDGETVTPIGLQVRRIVDASDGAVFTASDDPEVVHVWRWSPATGSERLTEDPGVHDAAAGGDTLVITSSTVGRGPISTVRRGDRVLGELISHVAQPVLRARPRFFRAGERELRSALLVPDGEEPDGPLPVLLDP